MAKKKRKPVVRESSAQANRRRNEQTLQGAVRKYLREAGIRARDVPGGVRVSDTIFEFTSDELRTPATTPVITRLVTQLFLRRMLRVTVEHLTDGEPKLSATLSAGTVRVDDARGAVAVISPTRALVSGSRAAISGNFLAAEGPHWGTLRERLSHPAQPGSQESAASKCTILSAFPVSLDDARAAEVLRASERIRLERSLEFGLSVVISWGGRSLRFDPITTKSPVEVPFVYSCDGDIVRGALRLRTPRDPLALVLREGGETSGVPSIITDAWTAALLAYAELTCVSQSDAAPTARPSSTEPRRSTSATGEHVRVRTVGASGATSPPSNSVLLAPSLQPTERTRQYLATNVIGHRRVLRVKTPSEATREFARSRGIHLAPSETWVKPHKRGLPKDAELVFVWRRS